eukprot:751200-Hanusia_phi.AAC.1
MARARRRAELVKLSKFDAFRGAQAGAFEYHLSSSSVLRAEKPRVIDWTPFLPATGNVVNGEEGGRAMPRVRVYGRGRHRLQAPGPVGPGNSW